MFWHLSLINFIKWKRLFGLWRDLSWMRSNYWLMHNMHTRTIFLWKRMLKMPRWMDWKWWKWKLWGGWRFNFCSSFKGANRSISIPNMLFHLTFDRSWRKMQRSKFLNCREHHCFVVNRWVNCYIYTCYHSNPYCSINNFLCYWNNYLHYHVELKSCILHSFQM